MVRFGLAVVGAVVMIACGGGEDPRDLTQEGTTGGATVQSGTVGATDTAAKDDPKRLNKNTDVSASHSRTATTN